MSSQQQRGSVSSVASTSSNTSQHQTQAQQQPKKHRVSSMCVPKGKWYDCLRPTQTPYQGFGAMSDLSSSNFSSAASDEAKAGTGDPWTNEVYGKMR